MKGPTKKIPSLSSMTPLACKNQRKTTPFMRSINPEKFHHRRFQILMYTMKQSPFPPPTSTKYKANKPMIGLLALYFVDVGGGKGLGFKSSCIP